MPQLTKEQIDELNAVVKVAVTKDDYQDKVETILKDYRKQANIPGFRKGHVPMGMIKKQYEQAVTADEVNKILREQLDTFIKEEKLKSKNFRYESSSQTIYMNKLLELFNK